jgi:hypothetical protein
MNAHDQDRIKQLLQQALPPIEGESEPPRDLWPALLRKMDAPPAAPPLFDWALLAAILAFFAFVPNAIPVLLYYL